MPYFRFAKVFSSWFRVMLQPVRLVDFRIDHRHRAPRRLESFSLASASAGESYVVVNPQVVVAPSTTSSSFMSSPAGFAVMGLGLLVVLATVALLWLKCGCCKKAGAKKNNKVARSQSDAQVGHSLHCSWRAPLPSLPFPRALPTNVSIALTRSECNAFYSLSDSFLPSMSP